MVKVEKYHFQWDYYKPYDDEVYITGAKVVIGTRRVSEANEICYHAYDFTNAQNAINEMNSNTHFIVINDIVDTGDIVCESVGYGDIISGIHVDENRDINITPSIYTKEYQKPLPVRPIPDDIQTHLTVDIQFKVYDIILPETELKTEPETKTKTKTKAKIKKTKKK